jgi:predicted RNase H-like HicB family nuclease
MAQRPGPARCWSQGSTRDAAAEDTKKAIKAWLEVEQHKTE